MLHVKMTDKTQLSAAQEKTKNADGPQRNEFKHVDISVLSTQ